MTAAGTDGTATESTSVLDRSLAMLDAEPDAPVGAPPRRPRRRRRPPTLAAVTAGAVADRVRLAGRAAWSAPLGALRSLPEVGRLVPSTVRMLRPVSTPGSPLLHGRSLSRRLDVLDVPVAGLQAAGRVAGGTLNDAYLAGVVAGLYRYHAHHASALEQLRVTMPINIRRADDDELGNRFTPARFVVDAEVPDPVERIRRVGDISRGGQAEPAVAASDLLAEVLQTLPPAVTATIFRGMLANVDLVCSDVPGIPSRSWLAGAELLREYPFAPPAGAALSVTLMSNLGTACIGVASDPAAVPDPHVLTGFLREGFDEVLAVAGPAGAAG